MRRWWCPNCERTWHTGHGPEAGPTLDAMCRDCDRAFTLGRQSGRRSYEMKLVRAYSDNDQKRET